MTRLKNPKTTSSTPPYHTILYHNHTFSLSLNPLHLLHSLSSHSLLKTPRKPPLTTTHTTLSFLLLLLSLSLLSFSLSDSHHSTTCYNAAPASPETAMVPLPAHEIVGGNLTDGEREFWQQPDGEGYRPCIVFGVGYRTASARIVRERRRFLVAVVSGGLNQQRNQIIDAVVIARILGAALVVPVLKVNVIWGDHSKFSDIFDEDHFKRSLRSDVRIVSSLPPTHLMRRPTVESSIPFNASPLWIRTRFLKKLNKKGVLVFKGLDSKLSKDLPLDLQKLRCKVAFHALRFAAPIRELGNKLARRIWNGGPYVAVHLRLEKDVWVRTGCLSGLGPEYDELVARERKSRPELLTGRLNITSVRRRLAGLCPLNGLDVARILRALGAPRSARVYVAGGEPLGGDLALRPLMAEFPNLIRKETLASDGELEPYVNKSSVLAAVDYIVSLSSDVFMPSHGGNMGRAMQGHRAYAGHRKFIKADKRGMIPLLDGELVSSDAEMMSRLMKELQRGLMGQPEPRTRKKGRDVIAYPVSECMCNRRSRFGFFSKF